MSILISWLGPLRAICMAIDGVAFSLLDNAYNLVIKLSTAELFQHETVRSLTNNMYILIGVVAFFRLALVLVNAIIDPEKLNEKGKGLASIFFRVVGMIILLAVTPFLFQMSYELQGKIVGADTGENIIFKTILGDNANIGGDNAGKALQNIVLSSLITIDKNYLVSDGAICEYKKDNKGNIDYDSPFENEGNCGFAPIVCKPTGDGKCTNQGGYIYGGECTWDNCKKAVSLYNDLYVNEEMSPNKLSKYVGVSKKIDDDEVYVYNYMLIITTVVGIAMTYIIISFAIDIAVRMFELLVLEVLSPLFIATFVDPKSAQSGPFKNWLSAVGRSYASLYIKLAILALMVLLISFINQSKIFQSMGDLSGWAKIITVIGLLIFAKKAPKWIGDMIGIKGDGGLGGLSIGKKLGGMALAGGLATKGLESLKNQGKKTLDNTKKRASNLAHRGISGIGAGNKARKQFDDKKWRKDHGYKDGDKMKLADRMRLNRAKNQAALGAASAKSAEINSDFKKANDMRMFAGIRDMYNEGAKSVDPSHTSRREAQLSNANIKAQAKLSAAGMDEVSMGKKKKAAKDLALTHDLYGTNVDVSKENRPINSEQMNNSFTKFFGGRKPVNDDEIELASYAASIGAESIDSSGNLLDSNGNILVNSSQVNGKVAEYIKNANPYLKQLLKTTAYENNIQVQSDYASVSENIKASSQKLREAMVQRDQFIINHPEPVKPIEPDRESMTDEAYKNAMEKYINDCTIYNTEMANWNSNLQVFNDTVRDANDAYNTYKDEKNKLVNAYINSSGIDPTTNLTYDEPKDNTGTILVDGKYINKYGEYIITSDSAGKKAYKFVQKDMSDYYDLITQLQDKKLNGPTFKGKLEDVKKQYSIESKKVEDKK